MKNIRRFRLFLLFFISLFVSLIFTTIIANSGTAYSAEQPAAKHQQLNRTATAVVSSPRVGVDKNRSDSPSSILGDAQNVEFVGQIGGATKAVAVQEEYAYVGEGPRLTVLDLTDPAAPAVLGKTPPLPGEVREVAVVGNYGYIAAKDGGLHVINITNPASPTEIGFFATSGSASGLTVAGNYVYVANGIYGLRIIDVSNPAAPSEIGFYDPLASFLAVDVAGNYAYVLDFDNGLHIIDVSNPAAPTEAGFYDTPGYAQNVTVAGNYAYIAAGDGGLRIINVANPTVPTEVGFYNTWGHALGVAVAGDFAYVTGEYAGFYIINVANQAQPIEIGHYDTPGVATNVAVAGNYAYVADNNYGLRIIDVSNPAAPTETGCYDPPAGSQAVDVAGNYAYVLDFDDDLRIIDVSDPTLPTITGFNETPGNARAVAVAGSYAYVTDYYGGLTIIDVANPAAPTKAGFHDTPDYAFGLDVAGDYAYVAAESSGLRIINVANPAATAEAGFYDTPGYAWAVAVAGNYAYVADGSSGLRIINIANPVAPTEAGFFTTLEYTRDVAVAGNFAYVATYSGLHIIDISNPAEPTETGFYATLWEAFDVAVNGNYAYVSLNDIGMSNIGLRIIDVSNPAEPANAGFSDVPGSDVAVAGNYVYVAAGSNGLIILRHYRPVMDVIPDRINLSGNPGDTLEMMITVMESGGLKGIHEISLFATDLTDDTDKPIPGDTVSFDPDAFELSAGGSKEVTMSVPLPGDLSTGEYSGSVTVESLDAGTISIPITIDVQPNLGSIRIIKQTDPSVTTSFSFGGDLGSFTLKDNNSKLFAPLSANDYVVNETNLTGWYLDRVECDSENVTHNDDGVTIHLQAGQDVTCTFRNHRFSAKADAGGPYDGNEGAPIPLDARGTSNKEIVTEYKWDCTADGTYDETSSSPTGSACTYDDNGEYTVKLRTIDIFDEKSTDTAQVTVDNVAPLVNAGDDQAVIAGTEVSFAGTFSDLGTADTHTIEWTFGDGSKPSGSLTPKHVFPNTGKYTVKLSVTDDDGDTGSDELDVDVFNSLPRLSDLKVSPEEIDEGGSFTLTGVMSDASTDSVLTLEIDWGDGQSQTKEFPPGSTQFSFDHSCADDDPSGTTADSYTIKLKLLDDEGAYSTETAVFKVHNVPPAVDAGPDKSVLVGENVNFTVTITDPGAPDTHSVTWNFGDGSTPAAGVDAAHIFNKPGEYTITVTITDDDGGVGGDSINVIANEGKKFVYLPLFMNQ